MSEVTDHYERLLAEHYSWMFGVSLRDKAAEQLELLARLKMSRGELAVDLGAGPGYQSMALADLGFERVLAIDTSAKLLDELRTHIGDRPIETIHGDMLEFARHVAPGTASAIVCMGDTLTHLSARELVSRLFAEISTALRDEGRLVLTYRDLSSELRGVDRFIPVRSTADKIITCFLEYHPDVVMVHDLIHVRQDGVWKLLKSCYPKLRLPVEAIRKELQAAGLDVDICESVRGMTLLTAKKI
jgi:SAM-dependent methyltransferase